MSAMSHEFDLSQATMLPPAKPGPHPIPDAGALASQWDAVHEAAAAVGHLAQLSREDTDYSVQSLPLRAAELGGWHYEMVARGIDDLAAVMQPGLRALLALTADGRDTTAAALTLWREFHIARAAILSIAVQD
ncbi:hypothetical protein [Qipengyuania marisflavi]|uniref:Uncharacterized protein n=1 Tax=Qipengyuania marisflavi TaxID=2486356 RepID=A0A5S3P5F8_9SPHN|nr:hypothetical protein [Qipengyuania marisflavi]TMM48272.1 hypothetical protein FEV51_08270 [Qipengyuania marisflavi]